MVAKRGTAAYDEWMASPKFERWRARLSASLKGRKVWNKGVRGAQSTSDATRQKMSDAHRRYWDDAGTDERRRRTKRARDTVNATIKAGTFRGGMYGKHHSEASKAKSRASNSTPENLAKHSRDHSINAISKQTLPEAAIGALLDGRKWRYVGSRYLLDGELNQYFGKHALPISADFVNTKAKTILMSDGCYWHECPIHGSGKFPDKPARDARLTATAVKAGWIVVRVWEHDVTGPKLAKRIECAAGATGRK